MCKYGLRSALSVGIGFMISPSHQTMVEQVLGSGAMTSRGSPSTMHSHICQSEGSKLANTFSGAIGGSEAMTCDATI